MEKRLSLKSLVLDGWARTSYSSLMPALVDTAVTASHFDPVFTRVSRQATDALLRNPTVGLLAEACKGVAGLMANLADGNDLSQADVRNIAKLFPYRNWIPLKAILSTMIRDSPSSATGEPFRGPSRLMLGVSSVFCGISAPPS